MIRVCKLLVIMNMIVFLNITGLKQKGSFIYDLRLSIVSIATYQLQIWEWRAFGTPLLCDPL
jgi:hypothetical protein